MSMERVVQKLKRSPAGPASRSTTMGLYDSSLHSFLGLLR